jgi:protein-L-isoaspartate(D-aspartate) O-methyltransferase
MAPVAVTEAGRAAALLDAGAEALAAAARTKGVGDERLLAAIRTTPRTGFLPEDEAVADPSLELAMVEALGLTGAENVLEVGTGRGWRTALLAKLARRVWSIERRYDMAESAAAALARHGVGGVRVIVGEGSRGLPGRAPYHTILVGPTFPSVPASLTRQLARGGRLVQPMGGEVVLFERAGNGLERVRSVVAGR